MEYALRYFEIIITGTDSGKITESVHPQNLQYGLVIWHTKKGRTNFWGLSCRKRGIALFGVNSIGKGAYNSGKHGKHGNLREFVNSGKHRENSGNLKFTQGIYQLSLGHRVMCIIVSNSSVNWLGDTVTGVDGASHHAHSI